MPSTHAQITAEAIQWFLRFQGTTPTGLDRRAFSEWLLRSPAHIEEYLKVSCAWHTVQVGHEGDFETEALIAAARDHRETDNVIPFSEHSSRSFQTEASRPEGGQSEVGPSGHGFSRRGWAMALAASLVFLVLGGGLWAVYVSWYSATIFRTAVGEQRSFVLRDGSVIFLNTDSKVRVRLLAAERHVDLIRGEARFQVAKDPARPFIVATTNAAVRAVGTVFNVRADPPSTQVAVLEGQVVVVAAAGEAANASQAAVEEAVRTQRAARSSIRLAAGQRAAVTSLGIEADAGPPIESVEAWTQRRLVFRDQPLSAVVGEFNRYRVEPLVIDDPELAALKISGAFDLSDTDSLIAYLGSYEGVQVEAEADGSRHLFRRPRAR